jgi:hypothetical protein
MKFQEIPVTEIVDIPVKAKSKLGRVIGVKHVDVFV